MALIEFKNLPDKTTPINAENLNHNFNELSNYSEITVGLSNSVSQSVGGSIKLPIDTILSQAGDKLSFSSTDNAIVIGANVNKIEVSGHVMQNLSKSTNLCGLLICKNNIALGSAISVGFNYIATTGQNICSSLPPVIANVEEGDKIYLVGYTNSNSTTTTYTPYSGRSNYLTVKVIN